MLQMLPLNLLLPPQSPSEIQPDKLFLGNAEIVEIGVELLDKAEMLYKAAFVVLLVENSDLCRKIMNQLVIHSTLTSFHC